VLSVTRGSAVARLARGYFQGKDIEGADSGENNRCKKEIFKATAAHGEKFLPCLGLWFSLPAASGNQWPVLYGRLMRDARELLIDHRPQTSDS
jgi:hypothetical protein